MEGKKVLIIFLVVLLLSPLVYAYSFVEFLQDFRGFITGKVVGREVVNEDRCEAKYLDNYKCVDNKRLRDYQKLDCSIIQVDYEDCENGCSDGECKEIVSTSDIVNSVPVIDEVNDDEIQTTQPIISGYLSVATLKQNYFVGEQINLTDPPAEEGKGFFGKLIEMVKGVFERDVKKEEEKIEWREKGIFRDVETREGFGSQIDFMEGGNNFDNFVYGNFTNYTKPIFKGYIIKFKEKSVGERRVELINKKEKNIDQDLLNYKNELEIKHEQYDNVLSSEINNYNNKKKFDYYLAFTGISLDINSYEVSKIKDLDFIESISPNYQVEAFLRDSVPLINADDVWDLGYTGEGIKIAIIDTGIDYTHEDLGGCFGVGCRVEGGYDFVNDDEDPMDDAGHGTHCAGIAAGNGIAGDGLPIKGVAPNATLYGYKVLSAEGYGYTDWILASFEYVLDPNQDGNLSDHLDIVSLSLGGLGNPNDEMSLAVDNMVNNGVVSVVAAGNSGNYGTIGSPGTSRKAITIGASTKDDEIADYSSRGPTSIGTLKPDVVAPGGDAETINGNICAARLPGFEPWQYNPAYDLCIDNYHVALAGTSMATPHVAGAVALIKNAHSDWTPDEIKYALRNTAVDLGYDVKTQGYGRIDVLNVVQLQNAPTIAEISTSGEVTGIINISGSVLGDDFDHYILYYGYSDNPTQWVELISSNISINNGVLFYNFDTTYLSEEEEYTLRLVVYNQYNESSEDRTFITPNNIELNSPGIPQSYYALYFLNSFYYSSFQEFVENTFLQIDSILINGTVPFGGGIISYDITYANENNQNNWFNGGIVLTNNFGENIILGYWNNIQDLEEGNYLLRLTVEHVDGSYSNITNMLTISKSQRDGWPLYYTPEEPIGSFVTIADVNPTIEGDELVLGIMGIYPFTDYQTSQVSVRDHGGNLLDGWPQNISFSSWTFPSVGDIDGDGDKEIVIASGRGHRFNSEIYAFNYDGSLVDGWPVGVLEDSFYQTTLSDLDGDGNMEVIVASYFDNRTAAWYPGYDNGTIHVLGGNGNYLEGWPKPFYRHNAGWHHVAVGDVDNDGDDKEIVSALFDGKISVYNNITYASLYIFDKNGNVLPGWPKNVSSFFNNFIPENYDWGLSYNGPTLVDLDGDYDLEIIVTINNEIFIFDHDGEMFDGWPQVVDQIPSTSAVIGDLDLDYPGPEIIFSSAKDDWYENLWASGTKIYVFHSDGSTMNGWPKEVCHSDEFGLNYDKSTPPIILDMNNDGYNEIVSTCDLSGYTIDNDVYVLDRYGNVIEGWPKKVVYGSGFSGGGAQGGFALGDIDNDGMLELTIASTGWYQGYSIYSWDLDTPNSVSVPWPMFGHDPQHTNSYEIGLPKSKIQNSEVTYITGYLLMKVQKKMEEYFWQDYQIVINDLETNNLRSIEPNGYLALDLIWNPNDVIINEEGDYRVYGALLDGSGNVINTDLGLLEDTYEFRVNDYTTQEIIEEVNV